ncbi:MAG: hypothetical protein HZA22_00385 [Nitrospirae bacterium]|nr:hypothetical protein [Nitrospirota bacterium]
MDKLETRIRHAMDADRDGIRQYLHDPSDKVVFALLANRQITEDELLVLAKRRDLPAEALGCIAARRFTVEGYKVKLALVNNPRTPRRVALGFLREMRLRDMAYVTTNKVLPTELRQAAEGIMKEKLPSIPLGVKIGLARQVSEDVIKTLLLDGNPHLIKACFENPRLKEAVVLWAVNHATVPARVVGFIAASQRWSVNQNIRYALVRNRNTPVESAMEFVRGMNSNDQRSLYNDPSVPVSVKVQLEIELERKGEPLSPPSESGRVIGIPHEIDEGEDFM